MRTLWSTSSCMISETSATPSTLSQRNIPATGLDHSASDPTYSVRASCNADARSLYVSCTKQQIPLLSSALNNNHLFKSSAQQQRARSFSSRLTSVAIAPQINADAVHTRWVDVREGSLGQPFTLELRFSQTITWSLRCRFSLGITFTRRVFFDSSLMQQAVLPF